MLIISPAPRYVKHESGCFLFSCRIDPDFQRHHVTRHGVLYGAVYKLLRCLAGALYMLADLCKAFRRYEGSGSMTSRRLFSAHSGVYSAVYEAVDTFSLRIGKRLYNVLATFGERNIYAVVVFLDVLVYGSLLRL